MYDDYAATDLPNGAMAGMLRYEKVKQGGAGATITWLGREKLKTTAIYTEVSIRQLQEVHARCHPAAKAPGPETLEKQASVSGLKV